MLLRSYNQYVTGNLYYEGEKYVLKEMKKGTPKHKEFVRHLVLYYGCHSQDVVNAIESGFKTREALLPVKQRETQMASVLKRMSTFSAL